MLNNYLQARCYIIAEIGGNFTNFEQAQRLIDEAAECGVDAVKLQTYRAETVASKLALFDMENTGVVSQYNLFKTYEIDEELHHKVFQYIASKKLDWFSTPSHTDDVDMLEKFSISAYKIGSDDAVNIPLLKYIAHQSKPVFLATGMCTMQEVHDSVNAILEAGNEKITLLHAVTSYPTHPENVNLLAMQAMMREFPALAIGYSDHTLGTTACICAAAMGAKVIEKHFTYDKKAPGPDHLLSADPVEMKEIVSKVREFEVMRGSGIKRPADSEKNTRINNRKSIVIVNPIRKGQVIGEQDIIVKRPGYGIEPKFYHQIVGRTANKNLEVDDVLMWGDC
ncbi:N-acetylneuraminate synthase [Sporomusaceae bacterium BoRhaA]|uniref:N-acetylneuraminate synthase family protein n=1 Tax=Pelorhabdus rhamnosifermentans TaxID=2772457 RepID=UPI001C060265|nr:N-acetylneuraminate synthase family protein [Pelorhabdus rhamnosifermentans]MBU2699169.1 N-acetylneuraminate synthase [Pelorhabdus rhamnosifermentans]